MFAALKMELVDVRCAKCTECGEDKQQREREEKCMQDDAGADANAMLLLKSCCKLFSAHVRCSA
jgi:hypothetical protein